MTIGKSIELSPAVLSTKEIPGGNRKLVYSVCGEYLVIDQAAGEIRRVLTFQEKEFMQAAAAFKAEAGGNNDSKNHDDSGERNIAPGGGIYDVPGNAVGLQGL